MNVTNSYIMGAVSEIEALKAVLQENNYSEEVISSISRDPGFKVKHYFDYFGDTNTVYVYPIGEGFYRIDFTS